MRPRLHGGQGHCITKIEKRHRLTTMEIAGWLASILREEKPARLSIDVGGPVIGIYERLMEQGYDSSVVTAVNFGNKPVEPPPLGEMGRPGGGPLNRRAELWQNMKNALQGRFSIPDDDALHADLTSCGYKYDSSGRLVLESKQDMKKRGMPSPDAADAMALCFTEPEGSPFPQSSNFNRKIEYAGQGYVCGEIGCCPCEQPKPRRSCRPRYRWLLRARGRRTDLTDGVGKPVRRRYSGEVYKQKLAEGDDPSVIAKRLTLSIWRSNTGGDASGGFNRRLNYPPIGIV
jgi:hypothetical protein